MMQCRVYFGQNLFVFFVPGNLNGGGGGAAAPLVGSATATCSMRALCVE